MILLRIVDGKGFDSFMVRHTCKSWATHAEFVDVERRTAFGAYLKGVAERPLDYAEFARAEYYSAPNITQAYEWAKTQEGKPYDFSAIYGIFMDRDWHDPKKWFCSELMEEAFTHTPTPLLNPNADVWRITPRDLLLSQGLIPVDIQSDWFKKQYGSL